MINFFKKISLLILLIIFIVAAWFTWQISRPASANGNLIHFEVVEGQGVKIIGQHLKSAGLINSQFIFDIWVYLTKTEKKFVAGEYILPANSTILTINRLLTGGLKPTSELNITLIEGWTINDMAGFLDQVGIYDLREFIDLVVKPDNFNPLLSRLGINLSSKPALASLEGYLFPDTYRVYQNSLPADLVSKMLNNFVDKVDSQWISDLDNRGYNLWQAIIIASIIEKEVSSSEDRELVSDIFWRRLQTGRGLEADSTINYITGKKIPAVSLDDIKLDSLYNTYKYRGLPPGPISNPGLNSIKAAIYPRANDYWYFLTTTDGQVIYSKTFAEHVVAKNKYLY